MLVEGIKLMFVGMTTVLLFLSFTILLIQIVSRLTRKAAQRELEAMRLEQSLRTQARKKGAGISSTHVSEDIEDDIAVIAAAVAAFEAELIQS